MRLSLANRKGLTLPMTILVMTALAAALAAGLAGAASEYTSNAAEKSQNRAYHLAETGLEQFLALRSQTGFCQHCGDPTVVDSEWTRVSLPGGYADVVAMKVRPVIGDNDAMFFIRSKGTDTSVKLSGAGYSTSSERTVGIYATWNTATMKVQAAWLSLSGLLKNGTGDISGIDQCHMQPDVAGVMVDSGDLVIKGGSFHPTGSPPIDTSNNFATLKAKTASSMDWAGIQGGAIPADITIPGQSFPNAAAFADTNYWPVIRIHTSGYSLPNPGRGVIIADSDFTISGSNMWDGVLLVGGQLTSNGNNVTDGATLSGLNFLTGGTPSLSTIDDATANGTKSYMYNSCKVSEATQKLRKYSTLPNSWIDNLASW